MVRGVLTVHISKKWEPPLWESCVSTTDSSEELRKFVCMSGIRFEEGIMDAKPHLSRLKPDTGLVKGSVRLAGVLIGRPSLHDRQPRTDSRRVSLPVAVIVRWSILYLKMPPYT